MPPVIIALVIPVVHSSGGWIAYTGGSYIGGKSWFAAFVLGNIGVLNKYGLVSAATSSIISAITLKTSASLGGLMTTVGLGGLAQSWGLVPATFLGLTAPAWGVVGVSALSLGALGVGAFAFSLKKQLHELNAERRKGGLEDISVKSLIKEIKEFETESLQFVLSQLSEQNSKLFFDKNDGVLIYEGKNLSLSSLRYVIDKDGSEWVVICRKRYLRPDVITAKLQVKPSDH